MDNYTLYSTSWKLILRLASYVGSAGRVNRDTSYDISNPVAHVCEYRSLIDNLNWGYMRPALLFTMEPRASSLAASNINLHSE